MLSEESWIDLANSLMKDLERKRARESCIRPGPPIRGKMLRRSFRQLERCSEAGADKKAIAVHTTYLLNYFEE